MSDQGPQDLGLQIKELERERLREELKQLKESASKRWIAPTVWIAVLPLLGGFGLWVVGEIKQYNKAYQALENVAKFEEDKKVEEQNRRALHTEILTLLAQKKDYANTAKELKAAVDKQQQTADRLTKEVAERRKEIELWKQEFADQKAKLDQFYLQIAFANAETRYALGHITASPTADPKALEKIRDAVKTLPKDEAQKVDELLRDYQLAFELSKEVERDLANNSKDLEKTAVSDWARKLEWGGPRGSMKQGRSIMVTKGTGERRYYDVELGKFVSKEKVTD